MLLRAPCEFGAIALAIKFSPKPWALDKPAVGFAYATAAEAVLYMLDSGIPVLEFLGADASFMPVSSPPARAMLYASE
ncbi:hypothetical protein P608_10135 [Comamonas thiooxydans]|uniref:Uncharacterized protein n=1 Tax=Comamonas thiooxydans TaxID=363952 RepID=A0A0E3C1Z2_9BURK|nr:hypothetical protein P608_10135 [Comamonas thiooxydans]KGH17200.1 hypothetical protein P607_18220 [Comamonas thiooxydans]